ncbi:MAG: sporulation protein YtfJ [Oscillospiraceae bacterium]|nr:sporulation protein YtfJ [Oscillospiraceae bacterium]
MENGFSDTVENIMLKIKELVETEVVVGTPMDVKPGTKIIPVSKVSFGFGFGGSDAERVEKTKEGKKAGFCLGSGVGVTLAPIGFLVVDDSGVKLLELGGKSQFENLIAGIPEFFTILSKKFGSKGKDERSKSKEEKS